MSSSRSAGATAPLRVGIDVHAINGDPQGSTTVWLNLLEALSPEHEYWLFSYDPSATRALLPQTHFRHARIVHRSTSLRVLWDLPRLARRHRCDVLHMNYVAPPLFAPPVVLNIHDLIYLDFPQFSPGVRRYASATIGWLSTHRAAVVTTISEYSKSRIAARFGIPPANIMVLPIALGQTWTAPDEAAIADAKRALAGRLPKRYILIVGRMDPRKNIPLAARIAQRLVHDGLTDGLVVIGSDDFGGRRIHEEFARDGTTDIVTRFSALSLHEVQAIYRQADLLLYPSLAEGFGLPLVEAMSMGTPIVASDRTAVPEVCGPRGVVVDPDDETAVYRAAHAVLTCPEHAESLRAAGFRRLQDFRVEHAARLLEKAYLRAAARSASLASSYPRA
jgi:glycosyltransferase involved in cell wall biosynthesis